MFQNQTSMHPANWQITNGMTVYATDGTKLGTVRNYDPQDGYLDVHKGWLFAKDFYVPFGAVNTVTEDGVVLRLTKDDLQDDRYSAPPATTSVVYGETFIAADVALPAVDKEPVTSDDATEVTGARTTDGRPIG
ncbi:MAG TPA: PRC-barrel domain-containing protein [Chloroflexota bacterium]|nr:PRC-barrel domain-containing protein [Chloroflexota bacterium]